MKLLKATSLALVFLFIASYSHAQERIKNRAENRANQRVDQKVDQAVDKAAGAIEGLFKRRNKNQNETNTPNGEANPSPTESSEPSGILSRIGRNDSFEPYQNPVLMNLSVDMTTTDKRGRVNEVSVHYTFDTWATGMKLVSEDNTARILLDNQNGKLTMISEDNGKTQGLRMRQPAVDYDELLPDPTSYTITDLGNTREIDRYSCREYQIEHEDGLTTAWITTDVEVDTEAIMRAMANQMKQNKNSNSQPFFDIPGLPIETLTVSTDGKEQVKSRYYNLKFGDNIDKTVFETDGVEIVDMGF